MLVTLDETKEYLGITESTYDDFLTSQIQLVSEAIEGYCGRKFEEKDYSQTFYTDDYADQSPVKNLPLFQYPVSAVTLIELDSEALTEVRLQKDSGIISHRDGLMNCGDELIVEYTAGYAVIPMVIKSVVYNVVGERYNKKKSGVNLDFGSDVQRISIPGTISIDFDYSLQTNERKTFYGTILGNNVNLLDNYRSERVIVGSGRLTYNEEVV